MDKPLTAFATEQEAYAYSRENGACVYDEDAQCAFCARWDH